MKTIYLLKENQPLADEILHLIEEQQPSILQRKKTSDRIMNKILNFVDTFVNGIQETELRIPTY